MKLKPKSVKLVDFKEELLPSGRKLLHYIFEDKYGSRYSWTAPWKDKEGQHGVERLFLRALEIEEWNDYEGVWSEELRKVSKEVPSLEEMELPVKIQMGEIMESFSPEGQECWEICVEILNDKEVVKSDDLGIKIGKVGMFWYSLRKELSSIEGVKFLSDEIDGVHDDDGWEIGIRFSIWVEKLADRTEYQIISREIASQVRHFIRNRLSEYKAIKRGFEEE